MISEFKIHKSSMLYDNKTGVIFEKPYNEFAQAHLNSHNNKYLQALQDILSKSAIDGSVVELSPDAIEQYFKLNGFTELILKTTDECNLRCKYCVYSDHYPYTSKYSHNRMSLDVAVSAADYYLNCIIDQQLYLHKTPFIAFYGGEPLLNFDIIKGVIEYIEQTYPSLLVHYTITTNVYILDQDKVQIAAEIANVASLAKLYETYGNLWTAFQSELEEANAVFYSNDEELHNTAIDLGSKMAASSSFIVRPPKLSRITLQFNDKCNLNCRKCGEVTCFPCMSCSAANTNRVISQEQVIGFFVYLSTFGLPDLHILGGDPLMDYTLLQHVVSAYKQLAPEGNVWVYTNAVSLIEYSNEELDFIKNNVNILLILCEENLLRMDSIINVMHKSQIRFEVQSRDLMQEFDESVLCNNTIDFIQKNKLPIVSHLNMKRNVTLYSNTNAGIRNQCYDGRIFISLDGSVGVCKQYLLPLSIINNKSWADIIHQLAKMWKKTFTSPVCENCGLSALCISCQHLHELYLKQSTEFPRAICFTQQSGKNKHRKEEEIHA